MDQGNLWGFSDASSSIYSNDDDAPILYSKPIIARQDTVSADSSYSTTSKSSTVYSEESIKSLGYRPFEYWKGPKPVASPSRRLPPAPLPPPRYAGTGPMKSVNALQDFRPLPKAKVLEVQAYIVDAAPLSPRVKDRYAARMAERARRKRERSQRMQRIEEWPGWKPDEKVLGQQAQKRRVRIANEEREERELLALRDERASPRTWRRREWGIIVTVLLAVLITVIVVVTTITQDNAPDLHKAPPETRSNYRVAVVFEAGDSYAPPFIASTELSRRSPPLSSPTARRIARRFKGRNS